MTISYFSSRLPRLANGGQVGEDVKKYFSLLVQNPDAFITVAKKSGKQDIAEAMTQLATAAVKAQQGDQEAVQALQQAMSDESYQQLVVAVGQALESSTQSMEIGGKLNYLECLKKYKSGGSIEDCGCHVKNENGGKISIFKQMVNKLYNR